MLEESYETILASEPVIWEILL